MLGAGPPSGCSSSGSTVKTGIADVVDCTTKEITTLITSKGGDVANAFSSSTDDHGSIDWGAVETKLTSILLGIGKDEATCLVADAVKAIVSRSGSTALATHERPSFESASLGFDKYRAAHDPGKTFHLARGDL
jgi:hypothetical protein